MPAVRSESNSGFCQLACLQQFIVPGANLSLQGGNIALESGHLALRTVQGSRERINFLIPFVELVTEFGTNDSTDNRAQRATGHATDHRTSTDAHAFFPGRVLISKCGCRDKTHSEPKQQWFS